jgi:hypothetical protein
LAIGHGDSITRSTPPPTDRGALKASIAAHLEHRAKSGGAAVAPPAGPAVTLWSLADGEGEGEGEVLARFPMEAPPVRLAASGDCCCVLVGDERGGVHFLGLVEGAAMGQAEGLRADRACAAHGVSARAYGRVQSMLPLKRLTICRFASTHATLGSRHASAPGLWTSALFPRA